MGLAPIEAGGREKRRYARQPTAQSAHVRFGEGSAISAEIRDYCLTGLYLVFPGGQTPDEALQALAGTPVQVSFAAGNTVVYRCDGRVAHASSVGVGIFVPAMPEGALRALRLAGGPPGRAAARAPASALDSRDAEVMKQACTSHLRGFLDAVMQDVFQEAGEHLREAGQEQFTFLERSRYEYGAEELARERGRIESGFFDTLRERVQHVEPVELDPRGAEGKPRLALVEEAEFEDWLNLSAVIRPVETELAVQLDGFERRYSRLAGVSVDRRNNPFGPEVIGRTFQGAIQALDFSNPMRNLLYKALGEALVRHGPALYRQLNETVASVEPVAVPPNERAPAPTPDAGRADRAAADLADALNSLYGQGAGATAPAGEPADYSLDRILAALAPASPRPAPAGRVPRATPDAPLLHVVDRLQQAAGRADRQTGGASAPAAPHASLADLLGALDGLPATSQAGTDGSAAVSLQNLIRSGIVAPDGARAVAPAHRRVLETASGLFQRAREDLVPSSDLDALIKRLERPLLKLALQDARFPSMPDHPARQVLDRIEQFAAAADDKGRFFDPKLQRFLYLLVDRICSRADADPGVFEAVRDSLDKVLPPILQIRRTRVARLQEASEGRERVRMARLRVNEALEARLAGKTVPAALLRLLDAGWRQHLVLLEMREGLQGPAVQAALAVLDRLFALLAADGGDPAPATVRQALLDAIEQGLAAVNVDTALATAFAGELADELSNPAAGAAGRIRIPPGRLHAPPDEGRSPPLVDGLRVGTWWEIALDGSPVPMQLIWVSQPPFGCAFANRSATEKREFTLAELSRRIQGGEAKPGKDLDLPLIERSEQSLFDETYRHLVQQAMLDPVTGLLNRRGFLQRLEQLAVPADDGQAHAVGIVEFDQFRMITNTCGVEAAEALSRVLAEKVRSLVGPDAVVAAFRDDTLALLLPDCRRADGCQAIERLLEDLKDHPFDHGPHRYSLGFNVGIAEYSPASLSAVEAVRRADSACLTAKALGRNRMQVYEQAGKLVQSQESLMDWAGRIDTFLKGGGLHLRCQQVRPIADDAGLAPYYEILLGIEGEPGIAVDPMHFIPAAERLQRAHEIDIWVMRNVFEWIGAHRPHFDALGGFAINLSATSLNHPEVVAFLRKALNDSQLPADKLTFEITETAAIGSYGAAQEFIREVRRYGCKFSLDDFGSGFTSYAHLKNLRTDALKIDGSFVQDMLENPADYAMVKSMNDVGHSLGLRTVAEYVESPMILQALRELGVDYAQGYAVHKPCRLDALLPQARSLQP